MAFRPWINPNIRNSVELVAEVTCILVRKFDEEPGSHCSMRSLHRTFDNICGSEMVSSAAGWPIRERLHLVPNAVHFSNFPIGSQSLAWVFAAAILTPDVLVEQASLSVEEAGPFMVSIMAEFFAMTAELLRRVRKNKVDTNGRCRTALREHLVMIWYLVRCITVNPQRRRISRVELKLQHPTDQPNTSRYIVVDMDYGLSGKALQDLPIDETEKTRLREAVKLCYELNGALHIFQSDTWSHLEDYTRHWLSKLEGEGNDFKRVMQNLCKCNVNIAD